MIFNRHVTHLLTRYVNGTLRASLNARVVNHVRTCEHCRAALAREERLNADVRRDLGRVGQPRQGQLAAMWSDVWADVQSPRRRFAWGKTLLPGIGAILAAALVLAVVLPVLTEGGLRVEAAPQQARPLNTASPVPNLDETQDARGSIARGVVLPEATVAFLRDAGATPAPVPQLAVSPEAGPGGARW